MIFRRIATAIIVLGALAPVSTKTWAQGTTSRLALVIGEAQYRDGPLATAANDGGLMADLLRQAGFDVTGAANLSQDQIRATFREFLEKAASAGPQAEIFVYLSGKGLQYAGENYIAPIEATIANSASVPAEAVRLADFTGPLDSLPARARVIVLDIAKPDNFGRSGQPLASGLALVDAADNSLVAFNTSPGTIAPGESGNYGAYAQSLVEMLRQPGLPLNEAFAQVRLRVNQATRGAQTPFHVSKLSANYALFAPAPGAPVVAAAPVIRAKRPMRDVPPAEAYGYAVEADTYQSYNDFLVGYPGDPLAARVRVMLAARREALTWRRTYLANTPEAYWTYLRRYPNGPHAPDAGRRLSFIRAALAPPPQFREYDAYDIPPPPPDEIVIIDRPRFYINEIVDVPPPRFADDFLPPIPREYRDLPPPPPPPRAGFLPIPVPIPIPFARPQQQQPGFVTAPRFVQQPVAPAPGGVAPQVAPVPQGYTATPPGGGRPQVAPPVVGTPPAATQTPATSPTLAPRPSSSAPTQAPVTAPVSPPVAAPSQTLPRPGTAGTPAPTPVPGNAPAGRPGSTPGQTLPQSGQPTSGPGTPPVGIRPTTVPQTQPSQTLPSPGTGQPAVRPNGEPLRPPGVPSPAPAPIRESTPPVRPTTTPTPPVAAPPVRETLPPVRQIPVTPPAPTVREPVAPRVAPVEPRPAPVESRPVAPSPRAEPPRPVAPPSAPPPPRVEPPREMPRAAPPPPPPAAVAPRPAPPPMAPPAAAPRPAPAPGGGGGGEGRGGGGEGRGGEGRGGGKGGPGGGEGRPGG